MPRPKVYPRFTCPDGSKKLLLLRMDLRGALSPTKDLFKDEVVARAAYKRLSILIENTRDFYEMQTHRYLFVFKEPDGWVWCVEDTSKNVLDFVWLRKKAEKLSGSIIELVKKELENAVHKGSGRENVPHGGS